MEIIVNGDKVHCEEGITLEQLIENLHYQKSRIAVEVNGEIIVKDKYGSCTLGPADRLEIVTFVGGG